MSKKRNFRFTHTMAEQLKAAHVSPDDIAWFQHNYGRRFAPLPDCKLRKLAQRAGFKSSAEFIAAERKRRNDRRAIR